MFSFTPLRSASHQLCQLPHTIRTAGLRKFAEVLSGNSDQLIAASQKDLLEHGATISTADAARLMLTQLKVDQIATSIEKVASLPDPVGLRLSATQLDQDLLLEKVAVPLGVFAVIFESRADVAPQILSLALRSANAVVLKGGHETRRVNTLYAEIAEQISRSIPEIPVDWFQVHHDREVVSALLTATKEIDLIIPRGSKQLIDAITRESLVPVLGHADGVCHLYIHNSALISMALDIIIDAKTQYPSACNALESILIDVRIAEKLLPQLIELSKQHQIELRGCQAFRSYSPQSLIVEEDQWHTEYGEKILAVKIVSDATEAINHIERYGSHHTDGIIAQDGSLIEQFLRRVDSANVFANCSTRFADGFRYGFGAEIGISTGRLHARGPVGIDGLMTYKYLLRGNGQIVNTYMGESARPFEHTKIDFKGNRSE